MVKKAIGLVIVGLLGFWGCATYTPPPPGLYIGEIPAEPITDLVLTKNQKQIEFRAPSEPGAYRLFVKILDNHGHYGGGNILFFVSGDS